MKYSIYVSLLSSIFPKNPYSATGLGDSIITSPIEALLSTITVNFGKISQDKPNFTARVSLLPAQKNQKTAACTTSRGFIVLKKGACKNV
jgi:hypothetical protein